MNKILEDKRIIKLIDKFPDFFTEVNDQYNLNISRNLSRNIMRNITRNIKNKNVTKSKTINRGISTTIITTIPNTGYTINTSGKYKFGNAINWTPSGAIPAITITANDVILDLEDFTLNCSNLSNFETIGILVMNASNVIIKDGKITNMGLIGVKVEECIDVKIRKIIVDGLTTDDITSIPLKIPIGIYFNICINPICYKCTIKNIDVHVGTMAGIQFSLCYNSKLEYCTIKNLINRDGACTGLGHALCVKTETKNCNIQNLQSFFDGNLNTQGHTCIGFIPIISVDLKFTDCNVNDIKGCCDDAHGMSMFIVTDVSLKNCKINGVTDGLGNNTGAKATGIELYAYGVKVSKCYVKNIKAIVPQDLQAAGFSTVGEDIEFVDCKAKKIKVCDADGNYDVELGFGTGFGWAPDPRLEFAYIPAKNVKYKKCIVEKSQVGFDSWNHISSVWKEVTSKCNGISIMNTKLDQRTLNCNACSECDPPIATTLTNQANNNKFLKIKTINC